MTGRQPAATGGKGGGDTWDGYRALSGKKIWWSAALIAAVGVGAAVWLLLAYGRGDDQARNQLEAIKTAGTIVVGTGGAAALLLAARRQWSTELSLLHQREVAQSTEIDAVERRITELYTKAADQLGSDKAAVRLAGLYALERLAQNYDRQRQTIVNVLCAYLRMPYEHSTDVQAGDAQVGVEHREHAQEREVRIAAQRILAAHLRPHNDATKTASTFWDEMDLDLTGSTLVGLDLNDCQMRTARFTKAEFIGTAKFRKARFIGTADFQGAQFVGDAEFHEAEFVGAAGFDEARFAGRAFFGDAQFARGSFGRTVFAKQALFRMTRFTESGWFDETQFADGAEFRGAQFTSTAWFDQAVFVGAAEFREANFEGTAEFGKAQFGDTVWFRGVPFADIARFAGVVFGGNARFDGATFAGPATFDQAQFNGTAGFGGSHFSSSVSFDDVQFSAAAKFGDSTFVAGPSLVGTRFTLAVPTELVSFVLPEVRS